jgi:hypothetical protein
MKEYKYEITLQGNCTLVDSEQAYEKYGIFDNINDVMKEAKQEAKEIQEEDDDIIESDLRVYIYSRTDDGEWNKENMFYS